MYCDIDYIKVFDSNKVLDNFNDDIINETIIIAQNQIDHYTNTSFCSPVGFEIKRACALQVLYLLESQYNNIDQSRVIKEKIDVYETVYSSQNLQSVQSYLAKEVENLLSQYIRKTKYHIHTV